MLSEAAAGGVGVDDAGSGAAQDVGFVVKGEDGGSGGGGGSDGSGSGLSVGAAIDRVGFGRYHKLLALTCGLGWGADAMWEEIAPVLLPQVEKEWPGTSSTVLGLLVAGQFAGMALGSVGWGMLSDRIGRVTPFRVILLLSGVSGVLAALSPNWWLLMLFLFVNGVGIGGNIPVDGAMYVENAPAKGRGSMIAILSLGYTSGSLVATAVAWALLPHMPHGGWRLMLVLCGVATIWLTAMRFRYGETATYLYMNGRTEEAAAVVQHIAAENGSPMAASQLTLKPYDAGDTAPPSNDASDTMRMQLTQHDHSSMAGPGSDVASSPTRTTAATAATSATALWATLGETPMLRRCACLLWAAWFFGVFGYIGLNSFLLILLERRGIFTADALYKDTFFYAAAGLLGAFGGVFLVETRIGRRGTIVASTAVATCCLAAAGISSGDFLVVFFAACSNCCFQTMFAGLTTYTPEVFPTRIRTSGTGIANMSARIAGMISPIACGALLDVSESAVLILCGALMAATAISAFLMPIETRGRTLE